MAEPRAPAVLLTLGRLPKALDLARGFRRLGWRVIVAEPYRWHLCAVSRAVARSYAVTAPAVSREGYLAELLAIIERESVTLVVPVSEESMHVSFLAGRLPAGVRLYAMPSETLLRLHSKASFITVASGYGLDVPQTAALGSSAATELVATGDVVVKPVYSCSGQGLSFIARGGALPPAARPAIVQRRVAGEVLSTFTIAHAGQCVATVVYRAAVLSGSVAVCFERVEGAQGVEAWVERFVARSAYTGFVSFDFVVDGAQRAFAIECNPRATSGVHFLEARDVARAVAEPGAGHAVGFRRERRLQQFFPCLTEVQRSMFTPRFRANLATLIGTPDVNWDWRDPLPLLTQPATSYRIIALALARGTTFGEVATLDVGWYEDPR